MKFYCDSCNTKYGIADEKVRGKVLKVRCKKCSNVITVREQSVPTASSAANSAAKASSTTTPPATPELEPRGVQWHYSINGQSFGPFAFAALEKRFATGELGDECYVWTDSFTSWKPVGQVGAFEEALGKGQQIKPRRKTIGASEGLEALDPEKVRAAKAAKQARQANALESSSPEIEQPETVQPETVQPETEQPEADSQPEPLAVGPTVESNKAVEDEPVEDEPAESERANTHNEQREGPESAKPEPDSADEGQKDRLAKLRARLKSKHDDSGDGVLSGDDLAADGGSPQVAAADEDDSEPTPAGGVDELGDATVKMPQEDLPETDFSTELDDAESSGLFSDFDASGEPGAPDDVQDSDHIPFLSGAPELGSEAGEAERDNKDEGITGSLLIQLDSIQKEGRGKKTLLVAVALLVVGGLVATAIYLAGQVEPKEPVVQQRQAAEDDDEELVVRTYSAEERKKIMLLGSQQVEKVDEEEAAEAPEQEKPEPKKVAAKQPSDNSKRRARGPKIKDDNAAMDDAFASAKKKGADDVRLKKSIDDGAVSGSSMKSPLVGKSDALNGLAAIDSTRNDAVYNPTDSLKEREKKVGKAKLDRRQISQGMRTVRRSVGLCRQRHSRRGAPLDARKIYLTLTVEPSGSISSFSLDPERIRHTEFDKCMNSHRARWRFPSFDGSPQTMRAPMVLQ